MHPTQPSCLGLDLDRRLHRALDREALGRLTVDETAAGLVRDAAPAARVGWVLDPLDHGEVVVVFLEGNDPGDRVKGDGAEAEV